jgi:uncharacterized membrane protein YecN with MAPEG domain
MADDIPEMVGHPMGDKAARKRYISNSIYFTVPGTLAAIALFYLKLVPPLRGLEDPSARLALAFRWLFVAMIPYAAVCMTILSQRFFEGVHNPLAGGESERLRIHCRVMQNTLEQLVWFAISILALTTFLAPDQMRIVPIACGFFALARFVYWWGYLRSGTLGRAIGVQLTFTLNILLLVLVAVRVGRSLVSPGE